MLNILPSPVSASSGEEQKTSLTGASPALRILVHICCGPCAITVLQHMLEHGHKPTGLFFNPNIQPLAEYMRRREGVAYVAGRLGIPVIYADSLAPEEQEWKDAWLPGGSAGCALPKTSLPPACDPAPWLLAVGGREGERCHFCWRVRLGYSASMAKKRGFDAFSTSLLYSRHQDHDQIRELGESAGLNAGLPFYYEDFRRFWQRGIDLSRQWGVYRQPYCGCLFSEYERYAKALARTIKLILPG